jgi:hypothetical protein
VKKLILGIAALTFTVMNSGAMAAAPRVPTNLCFTGAGVTHQLTLKASGTLKSDGGNIKQYAIFGHANTGFPTPVVGNAYIQPATTILHGTLNGAYIASGVHRNVVMEFFLDLFDGTGTTSSWLQISNGTQNVLTGAIAVFDCTTAPVAGLVIGNGHIDQ